MGGHRAAAQFLIKFRTDDGQTVASSEPNEVFSQSERASVPQHAINQTDIDASVRIHKNTHVCLFSVRTTDRHSLSLMLLAWQFL